MPLIEANTFYLQCLRTAHALCSDQKFQIDVPQIIVIFFWLYFILFIIHIPVPYLYQYVFFSICSLYKFPYIYWYLQKRSKPKLYCENERVTKFVDQILGYDNLVTSLCNKTILEELLVPVSHQIKTKLCVLVSKAYTLLLLL